MVEPIPTGALLHGQYTIDRVLGQGGFGITYLAHNSTGKAFAIKELAPSQARREDDDSLAFGDASPDATQMVKRAFVDEARLLQRLKAPGILQVRDIFAENETVYYATDYRPHSQTLEHMLRTQRRLNVTEVADILMQLAETLDVIHKAGIVHRDVKPSNVLWEPSGKVTLIDFGAAREWQADFASSHTILFTPGYAPIEQMSERARRGPATDIYGLCATGYALLTGDAPPSAPDRLSGEVLVDLLAVRQDLDYGLAYALTQGLAIQSGDRPQSIAEWLTLLEWQPEPTSPRAQLDEIDRKLIAIDKLTYSKRQCPECGGTLDEPKPLALLTCPVCQQGKIERRKIEPNLCPVCRIGRLHIHKNASPLIRCPICKWGPLVARTKALPWQQKSYECLECDATFSASKGFVTHEASGECLTWDEWGTRSGRSTQIHVCDGCAAEFDVIQKGRRRQVKPVPTQGLSELYPDEWAMVALGLAPDAGNASCLNCFADYFLEGDQVTLLETSSRDPFHFAELYMGRSFDTHDLRFIAVGKSSGQKGLVCADCGLEVDEDRGLFSVVHATATGLRNLRGEGVTFGELHRAARGLPFDEDIPDLESELGKLIRVCYRDGSLDFDSKNPNTHWRGPARDPDDPKEGEKTLTVTSSEITFGGLLKRETFLLSDFDQIQSDDQTIRLLSDSAEVAFRVTPLDFKVALDSGAVMIQINADDLAARLSNLAD
ncbi:MAG: serine/threonine protein kinase [Armatimonadetes bacterium]|nr:serine/threonine protein kinase [Armatimonadota bacterium]